jgi:hypothetical protein
MNEANTRSASGAARSEAPQVRDPHGERVNSFSLRRTSVSGAMFRFASRCLASAELINKNRSR